MTIIEYEATKLSNDKKGVLPRDSDGYYTVPVGALNVSNSRGDFYPLLGAKHLFDTSSALQRRISSRCLMGECGHPVREPGMSDSMFMARVIDVRETNQSHHIKKIWLDDNGDKSGLVLIMAQLIPQGPKGPALQQALENNCSNTCFSIRSFTANSFVRGKTIRTLSEIITWDWVTEPGIAVATKFNSPTLESLTQHNVSRKSIQQVVDSKLSGFSTESSKETASRVLRLFDRDDRVAAPLYSKW